MATLRSARSRFSTANVQEVLKYFLRRTKRKVNKDFSDVQLKSLFFKVDAGLRGDKVEVRWDPFSRLETVLKNGRNDPAYQRVEREIGRLEITLKNL